MTAAQPLARDAAPVDAAVYRGVGKRFGAVRALRDVDLTIEAGTIHALVGENGAGKSTCLGILSGRVAPSSGSVELFGRPLACGDPRAARRAGVVAIYQDLTIVPGLTPQANVFLGQPLSRHGFLAERAMRRRYEELCEQVGVRAMPANVPAGSLSVAEQQVLEILRGLVAQARVLLFDEPTASLGAHERAALLELMRGLRAQGLTLAFVSHNLEEVLDVADAISVFRDGRLEVTGRRADFTKRRLVETMLGADGRNRIVQELIAEPAQRPRPARRAARPAGPPLLQVEGLTIPGTIEDVALELHAGELLGLGGLVGAGRTSVLRALAGLEPRARGRLRIDGREVAWPRTVRRAQRLGIALAPEDRKGQGLALKLDAKTNVALADLGRVARHGLLSDAALAEQAGAVAARFGFDPRRVDAPAGTLSGGNQQKLLLARWSFSRPRILLVDEPTRGIDVGAKADVIAALEAMAGDGLGIVVVSSELEEVAAISHRVLVLSEGRVAGELDGAAEPIGVAEILHLAFRSSTEPTGATHHMTPTDPRASGGPA